jgi:hypothetical protein
MWYVGESPKHGFLPIAPTHAEPVGCNVANLIGKVATDQAATGFVVNDSDIAMALLLLAVQNHS